MGGLLRLSLMCVTEITLLQHAHSVAWPVPISPTLAITLERHLTEASRSRIESVIRDCIGDRPKEEEDWKIWIYSSSGYCQVTVKGPSQTRGRFFFDHGHTLPEKVRDWLESYPLR